MCYDFEPNPGRVIRNRLREIETSLQARAASISSRQSTRGRRDWQATYLSNIRADFAKKPPAVLQRMIPGLRKERLCAKLPVAERLDIMIMVAEELSSRRRDR